MVERARRSVLLLALIVVSLSNRPVAATERTGEPDRAEASGALFGEGRPQTLDMQLQSIYDQAVQAIAGKDRRKADFWLARYLGVATFSAGTARGYADLIPLFDQQEDLVPTAFISGHYSDHFLDFFIRGTYELWVAPTDRVRAADATFRVGPSSHGRYEAEVIVSPVLESWIIMKPDMKPDDEFSKAVIPLVAVDPPARLVVGIHAEGEAVRYLPEIALNADGNFLQYLWPLEWHDVDGDGTPEIWVRYNEAWGDGFSQVLEIYKIEHEAVLVLFKRFEGSAEGIARRLEDGTIEVAEGFTDQALTGHMGFDQHHIETFAFRQGEFVKVAERDAPHLLWSDEWETYYFGERAKD